MFDQTKHCTTLRISASSFRGSKAFSNPWPRTFIVLQYAMVLKKTSEIICQLMRSAATRTLFLGGKICFWVGQKIFGLVYFSPSSLLISKKKKVISPNCSIYFLVFCRFPKKSHPLETAARERGVWVGILGGRNFCLGGAAPFCSPVVAALLIRICPEHDTYQTRLRS